MRDHVPAVNTYFGLRSYLAPDDPLKALEIGSEPTPALYVAALIEVFAECWRVLRDDGCIFLNLGDSYASDTKGSGGATLKQSTNKGSFHDIRRIDHGLKPKDLIGIPWRVAFALQDAGWYLRSEIIWEKPSCMPESVRDRPTRSHEQVFLLTKNPTYFYDQDAVREPHARLWDETNGGNLSTGTHKRNGAMREQTRSLPLPNPNGRNRRTVWRADEPVAKLRDDLTHEQRAYVVGELLSRGLI